MLEMLYRIYEVATEEEKKINIDNDNNFGLFKSTSKAENNELLMDCMICDSREQFKSIIKDTYGSDIKFAYSKKYKEKQLYCIIIGEHCYNTECYFNKIEYVCDNCGINVSTYTPQDIRIDSYTIKFSLFGEEKYKKNKFCCSYCCDEFVRNAQKILKADGESEFFVSRDMFTEKVKGYIYKITKKSSGEFYIGQSIYVPIFRWGQHLKTDRFDIKNLLDYQFETIEVVPKNESILDREKYWIQKYYKDNPSKSLNIMQTSNLDQITIDDILSKEIINHE